MGILVCIDVHNNFNLCKGKETTTCLEQHKVKSEQLLCVRRTRTLEENHLEISKNDGPKKSQFQRSKTIFERYNLGK